MKLKGRTHRFGNDINIERKNGTNNYIKRYVREVI